MENEEANAVKRVYITIVGLKGTSRKKTITGRKISNFMEAYRQKSHIIIIIQNGFETNLDILLPYMGNGIWLEFKDYRKMVQMVQYYDEF